MRQAIITKFLSPTNHRGSRIKAVAAAGAVTLDYDHGLNQQGNHDAAAKALALKLDWKGAWYAGGLPTQDGNCYVWDADGFGETFRV